MIKRLVISLALIAGSGSAMAQSAHTALDPDILLRLMDELRLRRERANDETGEVRAQWITAQLKTQKEGRIATP
jgi:hypothetical protein